MGGGGQSDERLSAQRDKASMHSAERCWTKQALIGPCASHTKQVAPLGCVKSRSQGCPFCDDEFHWPVMLSNGTGEGVQARG